MSNELQDIADSLQNRLAEASRKESEARSDLFEAQQEKLELQAAFERVDLLSSGKLLLDIDDCIECFVFHKRDSKMTQIPSDSAIDKFRCRACGYEREVKP